MKGPLKSIPIWDNELTPIETSNSYIINEALNQVVHSNLGLSPCPPFVASFRGQGSPLIIRLCEHIAVFAIG